MESGRSRVASAAGILGVASVIGLLVLGGVLAAQLAGSSEGNGAVHGGGERFRTFKLDEGRAGEVAVATGDRILLKWRAPGDTEWSRPKVVYADEYGTQAHVRVVGTTVAIRADFNTQPTSDEADESGEASTVFIACDLRECETSRRYLEVAEPTCERGSCVRSRPQSNGVNQVPELSADGKSVFFGVTERGYALWEPESGIRDVTPEGGPDGRVAGSPMLAPDGTFRIVGGQVTQSGCRFTLFSSAAFAPAYTGQLTYDAPARSPDCRTTLESFSPDYVLVHTAEDPLPTYAVRNGSAWRSVSEDPSGMVRYSKAAGRTADGSVVRTGYWHWREIVTASPDGHQLVAQVHFPGEPMWSKPKVIAEAPEEAKCFEISPTSTPSEEPFYVSLRCRSRPTPNAQWTYMEVNAITEDGHNWQSFASTDQPTRVGEDLFFAGHPPTRWSASKGIEALTLPVPTNGTVTLTDDGTYVLVTLTPEAAGCRMVARIALPEATDWSAPLPSEVTHLPRELGCEVRPQYDGATVGVNPSGRIILDWSARIVQRDGVWVVEDRQFSEDAVRLD